MKNVFFNKYDSGKPTIITNNLFKQKILKSFIKKYTKPSLSYSQWQMFQLKNTFCSNFSHENSVVKHFRPGHSSINTMKKKLGKRKS